jgi:plastocyanin
MTRTRISVASAAAVLLTAIATGIAIAGTERVGAVVQFKAAYSGQATVKVTDNVADISAEGTGTATIVGASKVTGKGTGDSSKQPCVPFTGDGVITASSGSTTVRFTVVPGSTGCGDEAGKVFSISGRATVTGGTGSMAGAKGTLKLTGVYDHGAGTFSIKFSGPVTTGGAAAPAKTTLKISAGPSSRLAFSRKTLSARAGRITILMKNTSGLRHNIALRRGTTSKSRIIVKGAVVRKGGTSRVTATLTKGKYRYVCTVPGHEAAGMWGILTVR